MTNIVHSDIGSRPTDWSIQRVDSLFDIKQGKSVSKAHRIGDNQRPFLRTKNVFWGRIDLSELDQMHFTEQEETRLKLQVGDLLLCEGGDVGRTAIWSGEMDGCYYQNHLHRLRTKTTNEIDPHFALYWFWYAFEIADLYVGRSNVTTIPNLSQSKLSELQIPKPDFTEQQRIARVLATIQTAIEYNARMVALTYELKAALVKKLFTEGLHGGRQKETEIGLLPERWEVVKFGDYAEFKNGINFSAEDKGEGVLTVDVLNMYGEGCSISLDNLYRVNKKVNKSYLLEKDDLLFVRSSLKREGVGWTSLFVPADEPVTFCGFIIRARLKDKTAFSSEFLTNYFRTDMARSRLVSGSGQVAITNINQGLLKDLPVPNLPLEEQIEIATTIGTVDKKIASLLAKKEKLQELFRTLLHQLMTAQIRVDKIDLPEIS